MWYGGGGAIAAAAATSNDDEDDVDVAAVFRDADELSCVYGR